MQTILAVAPALRPATYRIVQCDDCRRWTAAPITHDPEAGEVLCAACSEARLPVCRTCGATLTNSSELDDDTCARCFRARREAAMDDREWIAANAALIEAHMQDVLDRPQLWESEEEREEGRAA